MDVQSKRHCKVRSGSRIATLTCAHGLVITCLYSVQLKPTLFALSWFFFFFFFFPSHNDNPVPLA
jgi:hypothetical protein